MEQNYFFVPGASGEYATDEYPISVNCGGVVDQSREFVVHHNHGRKDYTFYYLYQGSLSVTLGDEPERTLEKGALLAVPPQVPFWYRHRAGEPILFYWVHFTGNYAKGLWEELEFPKEGLWQACPQSEITRDAFLRFLEEMKNPPDAITRQRTAGALYLLAADLSQLYKSTQHCRRLERSFAYLQEHFTRSISVKELAAVEQISVSRYHQLFRSQTGQTPNQYVTLLRMKLAKRLLTDASYSVQQVAAACGYEDAFYFSRVFRQEYGVSPNQYRKQR